MEEHKKQETGGQLKTLWLVSGIAKKDITLEPVQVQEATLAERSVRWELGNTPTRISWSVVRTPASACKPMEKSEPEMAPVPGMERHVQWCQSSQKARISWQTTRSDKSWPTAAPQDEVTAVVPRRISWNLTSPGHAASWVKPEKRAG